jgi:dTDP-4-dehydrorhamnose 3,5-epimerase-like enzyme
MKRKRILKSYWKFSDNRGLIRGIFNSFKIEESNFIQTKKNIIRGQHYHKKLLEIIHVVEGVVTFYIFDIKKKFAPKKIFKLKSGQTIIIYPFEFHWSLSNTNSKCINYLTKKINFRFPDIHKSL